MKDYKSINELALDAIQQILSQWLPDGKREGNEYVALNPTRSDKTLGSFKINLKTGVWSDFSSNDSGGDLISLIAYLDRVSQSDAATSIEDYLGSTSKKAVTSVKNVTIGKGRDFLRALKVTKFGWNSQQHFVTKEEEVSRKSLCQKMRLYLLLNILAWTNQRIDMFIEIRMGRLLFTCAVSIRLKMGLHPKPLAH